MSFRVRLYKQPRKFLERCRKDLSERIRDKLRITAANPFKYLEHYAGDDVFKLRIGQYRVLIDVDHERKMLYVRYLEHRSKIYKRFKSVD